MNRGKYLVSLCTSDNNNIPTSEPESDNCFKNASVEDLSLSQKNDHDQNSLPSPSLLTMDSEYERRKDNENFLEINVVMEECYSDGTEIRPNSKNKNNGNIICNDVQGTNYNIDAGPNIEPFNTSLQEKDFTILNIESAPPTVLKEYTSPIPDMNPPLSAPLPANTSPLSLGMSIEETVLTPDKMIQENSQPFSSSIAKSSPISGIFPLGESEPENFYSDSGSSWVPDSDEDRMLGSLRKKLLTANANLIDDCPDDGEVMQINFPNDSNTKRPQVLATDHTSPRNELENDSQHQSGNSVTAAIIHSEPVGTDKINNGPIPDIINNRSLGQEEHFHSKELDRKMISDDIANIEVAHKDKQLQNEEISTVKTSVDKQKDKKLKRKRQKNDTQWKRNIGKRNRDTCLPYKNKLGKSMPAKLPKIVTCSILCRNKCNEKFNYEARLQICRDYWGTRYYNHQKDYLLKLIKIKPVQRGSRNIPPEKQRTNSREYSLYNNKMSEVRVCKKFFMATLCISNGPIETAIKSMSECGTFDGKDQRGARPPANKTRKEREAEVKAHIEKFPTVESHYCRKKSKRLYLDATLSIRKMYQLYEEEMKKDGKEPVKFNVYQRIFCNDYNISFFTPKKDQCLTCNTYLRNKNPDADARKVYQEHIERKNAAYASKQADKEQSENSPNFLCATMDLQSVLQIPATSDSLLYYSRKLNVYNLSIYESKPPNRGHCLIWSEVNGKRGSIEIASALNKWLKDIPDEINEIVMYSDTCAGQNRNQYLAAFLMYVVQTSRISVFEQKYLESGHSFMEVDSMHSAIETEKKHTDVFSITDWKRIMKGARSQRYNKKLEPYQVQELFYKDMIDIKAIANKFINNRNTCADGIKIQWLKIKCLRYEKNSPGCIQFRYGYEGSYSTFNVFSASKSTAVRTRRRCVSPAASHIDLSSELKAFTVPSAYSMLLPISNAKKNDLLTLCKKGIIPIELHHWYESLPSVSKKDAIEEENLLLSEDEEG